MESDGVEMEVSDAMTGTGPPVLLCDEVSTFRGTRLYGRACSDRGLYCF